MPPAANAPTIPTTRPRMTGVPIAYFQPSTTTFTGLPSWSPPDAAAPFGIVLSRWMMTPETKNVSALK